jgi:glycosyltransferase involved in cell wall biosynthesis
MNKIADPSPSVPDSPVEVSVVIPCLNEAETLGTCIDKALEGLRQAEAEGEVVVADNGSTDGSVELAEAHGARVVHVARPGYGSALMGGIAAARGRWDHHGRCR